MPATVDHLEPSETKKPTKRKKTQKIVGLIVLLMIVTAAGFAINKYWWSNQEELKYFTAPAMKADVTDAIQATGTLEPVQTVNLSFKLSETINFLDLQPGDRVTKGQVLAKQDTTELSIQLQQAEGDLIKAETQLERLTIANEQARKNLEQQEELFAAGLIAQVELDQARVDFRKSELDLTDANIQLANCQAKVVTAQKNLESTTLLAPYDGIVAQVNGVVGQSNGGGNTSENALITLISEEMQLEALVNEVDIGRIKVGQAVEFTSTAYPNQIFHGKVEKIYPEPTTVSNVKFYPAYISCEDPDKLLQSGMSVSTKIIVARQKDVLTVPMLALTFAESYIKNNREALGGSLNSPSSPDSAFKATESAVTETEVMESEVAEPKVAEPKATKPVNTENGEKTRPANSSVKKENRRQVMVLEAGQPVVKPVVVGLNDGQNIEIIEGLNPGDQVIISTNQTTQSAGSTGTNSNPSNQPNRSQGNIMIRTPGTGPGMGSPGMR